VTLFPPLLLRSKSRAQFTSSARFAGTSKPAFVKQKLVQSTSSARFSGHFQTCFCKAKAGPNFRKQPDLSGCFQNQFCFCRNKTGPNFRPAPIYRRFQTSFAESKTGPNFRKQPDLSGCFTNQFCFYRNKTGPNFRPAPIYRRFLTSFAECKTGPNFRKQPDLSGCFTNLLLQRKSRSNPKITDAKGIPFASVFLPGFSSKNRAKSDQQSQIPEGNLRFACPFSYGKRAQSPSSARFARTSKPAFTKQKQVQT